MSNTHQLDSELVLLGRDASRVTIREAAGDDQEALARLAQLDSARPFGNPEYRSRTTGNPESRLRNPGVILVAEAGGELRAAYSLSERRAIADPFHRTAELVEMLELHAKQASAHVNGRPKGRPRRPLRAALTRAARA